MVGIGEVDPGNGKMTKDVQTVVTVEDLAGETPGSQPQVKELHLGVIAKSKKSNSGLHLDVMTNLEEVMTVAGLMTTGEMTDATTAAMTADLIAGMTVDLIAVMTALMNVEEEAAGVVHLAVMIVDLTVGMTAGMIVGMTVDLIAV